MVMEDSGGEKGGGEGGREGVHDQISETTMLFFLEGWELSTRGHQHTEKGKGVGGRGGGREGGREGGKVPPAILVARTIFRRPGGGGEKISRCWSMGS
jgi:hypothetical protein